VLKDGGLRRNSQAQLDRLLQQMLDEPEREADLTREVETQFGETRAILALDMSGFSRTTQLRGIVAFLLMIHRMRQIVTPVIEAHGGLVVKAEADNLYCLLETVEAAVNAARELIEKLEGDNQACGDDRQIYVSIGIGWGAILNIDEDDLFGDEVNLASKLGEDLAGRSEVLLTQAAQVQAQAAGIRTRESSASISGLPLIYHQLVSPGQA
jgi:class 3 adenylate cyclase